MKVVGVPLSGLHLLKALKIIVNSEVQVFCRKTQKIISIPSHVNNQ